MVLQSDKHDKNQRYENGKENKRRKLYGVRSIQGILMVYTEYTPQFLLSHAKNVRKRE